MSEIGLGWPIIVMVAAFFSSAGLIMLLHPLFRRYAMARPNARSSHREPTPQGGGAAVVAAALVVAWLAWMFVVPGGPASTTWNPGSMSRISLEVNA